MEKHINDRRFSKPREIISIINTTKNLFEFHNTLMEVIGDYVAVYFIETELRESLYNIIEEIYGGYLLYILKHLHLRMEELKSQNELYDRIIRLSYIYCSNNVIDYPPNVL